MKDLKKYLPALIVGGIVITLLANMRRGNCKREARDKCWDRFPGADESMDRNSCIFQEENACPLPGQF